MTETEEKIEKKSNKDFTSKMRENPWVVSTIVLSLACLILLFLTLKPGLTGNVIAGDEAGKNIASFLNSKTNGGVEYVSYKDLDSLYEITVKYQEQEIPVYITKDGKYFVQAPTPITGETINNEPPQQQEVPKSDKPKVEAFVFSYCPYGLQFEKALLPAYKILKNKADIKIVFIGAMHGEYEKVESIRQLCIQKEYGKEKLFAYLEKFMGDTKIGDCEDDMNCSKQFIENIMAQIGVDKNKINSCMSENGEALYINDSNRAAELGISGSPTFVINNVEVSVGRSAEEVKKAICSAFNTQPAECQQTLSTQQATPWFGYSASTDSSSGGGSCS